jgi:phospho-N-acetylmuramoyl-pentapeptide-transferase
MLYALYELWLRSAPGAGLLGYTSFRAAAAAVTAFLLALVLGRPLIAWLRARRIGEDVTKTDSARLAELHGAKQHTPTMGGLFLVGAMLSSCVLWLRFDSFNRFSLPALALLVWFAAVGLADDWIKLRRPGRKGLAAREKQLWLSLGAALIGFLLLHYGQLESARGGPHLYFPFFKDWSLPLGAAGGLPFVLLTVLVLTGAANAVNLTDGLDGLAIGCVALAAIAYAGIVYFVGHSELSQYLLVQHVPGSAELTVLLGALLGASLGFLWYNAAPALVFMGDVGSLALGGALGYAALVSRTELVLLVVGGVFVAEAVSVIVQVASFKTTGRRVLRCAPLHHHFQFGGMPETRIVARIWIVQSLLALSSLALFKVR